MNEVCLNSSAQLFTNDFFHGLEASVLGLLQAQTLPPQCYTDAAFFEFEKEAVFNHEWLCVGRESWVSKVGDYFTTTMIGEPVPLPLGLGPVALTGMRNQLQTQRAGAGEYASESRRGVAVLG